MSDCQRDQHGYVKSGVVFEGHARVDRRTGQPISLSESDGLPTCVCGHCFTAHTGHAWTGNGVEPTHCSQLCGCKRYVSSIEAGLRAQVAALTSELATKAACIAAGEQAMRVKDELLEALRGRVADTLKANRRLIDRWMTDMERAEGELAAKDRFVAGVCERLNECSEALGRVAEGESMYEPPTVEELREYEGEPV